MPIYTQITRVCPGCQGDGFVDEGIGAPRTCPKCNGETLVGGVLRMDVTNLVGTIGDPEDALTVRTYRILDATDISEYNALSDDDKTLYHLIISAGIVDLQDGTNTRTVLMAIFGPGTTTRANLIALIGE